MLRKASVLTPQMRRFLDEARRAVLVTLRESGRPRAIPICYAVMDGMLLTPIDEKVKTTRDPLRLGRVLDIQATPEVLVLVDRWAEDWEQLAWLRIEGHAEILPRADAVPAAIAELRRRYPPYAAMDLEARPLIRIGPTAATAWGALPT